MMVAVGTAIADRPRSRVGPWRESGFA